MGFFWTIVVLVITLGSPGDSRARTWPRSSAAGCIIWPGPNGRSTGCSAPARKTSKPGGASQSAVIFSALFLAFAYLLLRIQGSLPLNPQDLGQVKPALSFKTAVSFLTNTNWQNYGGETTMSYFSQIGVLSVQRFGQCRCRHGRRHRGGERPGPAKLADDRQLLGGYHPLPAVHPSAHSVRGRHRPGGPGRRPDPVRTGHHPPLAQRAHSPPSPSPTTWPSTSPSSRRSSRPPTRSWSPSTS
jgi:hypothetical protein